MEGTGFTEQIRIAESGTRNRLSIGVRSNLLVIVADTVNDQISDVPADSEIKAGADCGPGQLHTVICLITPVEYAALIEAHALIRQDQMNLGSVREVTLVLMHLDFEALAPPGIHEAHIGISQKVESIVCRRSAIVLARLHISADGGSGAGPICV